MNSRIRLRGVLSKEIVIQRDQISNLTRPVDDTQLSEQQYLERVSHNPQVTSAAPNLNVGGQVYVKRDGNTLKPGKKCKVIDYL